MFQYEVKFTPDIDNRKLRTQLLRQHAHILGNARTFDGTLLYLPFQLPDEVRLLKNYLVCCKNTKQYPTHFYREPFGNLFIQVTKLLSL